MANESIFADEWRECLQAQYRHVIRNNDQITLKTLDSVMHEVGYSDDDLRRIAFEATLRAEDLADDFVPDMEIMSGAQPVVKPDAPPEISPVETSPVAEAVPAVEVAAVPDELPVLDIVPPEELSGDDLGMTLADTLAVVDAVLADEAEAGIEAETEAEEDLTEADELPSEPESTLPPGMQQLSLF